MIKEGEQFGIAEPFPVLEPHLVYFVALLYLESCGLNISFRLFSKWEGMTEARSCASFKYWQEVYVYRGGETMQI